MSVFKRILRSLATAALRLIPARWLERVMYGLAAGKASGLPPSKALQFLLRLDQRLYGLQGEQAIRYGGGVHVKHRLTRYHEFFIAQIGSGDRVLDVGCGIGAVAHDVAVSTGAAVTGIDIDAGKIALAHQRYQHPQLTFVAGDALADLPPGRFDAVILSNLLEHVEARVEFLRTLTQRIRPARYLIRVPLFERDWRVPLKQELGVDYRLDPTHCTEHRFEELLNEFTRAGLQVVTSLVRWGEVWAVCVPAPVGPRVESHTAEAARHA